MKLVRGIIWTLTICLIFAGMTAYAEGGMLARLGRAVNREEDVSKVLSVQEESFLFSSVSTWKPSSSGGEKYVQISSSEDWYVVKCPEWISIYVLREKEGSYEGKITWELHRVDETEKYPSDSDVFFWVDQNAAGEILNDEIILGLGDGTRTHIRVIQPPNREELSVEIVRPCADAADTVPAGYVTKVEIRTEKAVKGKVQITDAQDRVIYSESFIGENYAFDFVFEEGCYEIVAEAASEEYIGQGRAGYVSDRMTINTQQIEYLEEIGVTKQYVEYIKIREGKRNMPYLDAAGHWTIGYGHLISAEAAAEYKKMGGWSDEQCEQQLMEDLKFHAELMKERLPQEIYERLTPNQFDALMSMEFNACGRAVSEEYRLGQCIRKLDTVQDYEVINGFITWHGIEDGKYDLLGLYYRRMEEARIFLYADYSAKYNWPIPWWLNVSSGGKGRSIHDVPSGSGWLKDIMPQLETSTALIRAESAGMSEFVTVRSSGSWTVLLDDECSWIGVSSSRGSSGDVVRITVHENTGEARHGIVKVSCGAVTRTVHVHQSGS